MQPDYQAYLSSAHWQEFRNKAHIYYRYRCAVCGTDWRKRSYLAVHHLHYRTLGHESLSDVRLLCSAHHPKGTFPAEYIRMWRNSYLFGKVMKWVLLLPARGVLALIRFLMRKPSRPQFFAKKPGAAATSRP